MIVGPTVLSVSIGTGAPARIDSSKKMNWSIGLAALAAVLLGPADAGPAVGAHLLPDPLGGLTDPVGLAQLFDGLLVEELVVVGPQLVAEGLLFGRVPDLHGGDSSNG